MSGVPYWSRTSVDPANRARREALPVLEQDGLVSRYAHPEIPPRVEYTLTELGTGLMRHMVPLCEWIAAHAETITGRSGDA